MQASLIIDKAKTKYNDESKSYIFDIREMIRTHLIYTWGIEKIWIGRIESPSDPKKLKFVLGMGKEKLELTLHDKLKYKNPFNPNDKWSIEISDDIDQKFEKSDWKIHVYFTQSQPKDDIVSITRMS